MTIDDQLSLRGLFLLHLTTQTRSGSWELVKKYEEDLDSNEELKKFMMGVNKKFTFLRTKFLEYAFSEDENLKKWSGLLQNVQKLNSRID